MAEQFRLNPYVAVFEHAGGFVIGSAPHRMMHFGARDRPVIDFLTNTPAFDDETLRRYIGDATIRELFAKHVLVEEAAPLDGRYSRQLGLYSLIGSNHGEMHDRIRAAHVLILGAGAIGSHVAWNLAALGAGTLTIVDADIIEESNLNRQLLYVPDDIGKPKSRTLCDALARFNPDVHIRPLHTRILSPSDIDALMDGVTLVVKAIDSPSATLWVNAVCVARGVPFVGGGFLDDIGIAGPTYLPGVSACAACIPAGNPTRVHGTAATFAPLTTLVAAQIAMIAFRIVTGDTAAIADKLYVYNTSNATWDVSDVIPSLACATCGRAAVAEQKPRTSIDGPLWAYRGTVFGIAIAADVFAVASGVRWVSALGLAALFAALPSLWQATRGDLIGTRRQLFITSVAYAALALVAAAVGNASAIVASRSGDVFEECVAIAQGVAGGILAGAVLATLLFVAQGAILEPFVRERRVSGRHE